MSESHRAMRRREQQEDLDDIERLSTRPTPPPLDARAHAGDGETAAREAGATAERYHCCRCRQLKTGSWWQPSTLSQVNFRKSNVLWICHDCEARR